MKTTSLLSLVVIANTNGYAQSLKDSIVFERSEKEIEKALNNNKAYKYVELKEYINSENSEHKLAALTGLLVNISQSSNFEKSNSEPDQLLPYLFAWHLAIKNLRNESQNLVVTRYLNLWDSKLSKDNDLTPVQIYALVLEWDHRLITKTFWKLLSESTNDNTVLAISYVLYKRGDAEDLILLEKAIVSEKNPKRVSRMQNASNWLRFRLYGKPGNPGPPTGRPMLEI
ncbi:MAG: hypothetical protein IPL96_05665 [Holophagaceae bacterium]|nr:hypothetical protein [Holophagaceae bacterium]